MRLKLLQVLMFVALLLLGSVLVFGPSPKVYASNRLQDAPNLDGVKIYFTEANEESSRFDRTADGLSRFAGLLSDQGAELETLEWRATFPTDADLVIVAGPLTDFYPSQTARLWNYIDNGGKVLMLAEPLRMDRGRTKGLLLNSGLMDLFWTDLGLRVRNDLVVTEGLVPVSTPAPEATAEPAAEATAEATAEAGAGTAPAADSMIQPPNINFTTTEVSEDQPILDGITGPLAFFNARSIEIDLSIRDFPIQPLIFSGSDFYGENNIPAYYEGGVALYNIGEDVSPGFLPLATAYENDETGARIVVIGDRDFATNGGGIQSSPPNTGAFLYPDNVRFLLNSVAWLVGADAMEVTFPTPGPTATPTLIPTPNVLDPLAIQADLAVTISASNIRPVEGEIIIYDITVLNNGPDAAEFVVISDPLPTGIQYIMGSGGTFDGETNKWIVENLEPNEGLSLRMVVGVLRGTVNTTIINQVEVSSENLTDPDPNNNVATAEIVVAEVILKEEAPTEGG